MLFQPISHLHSSGAKSILINEKKQESGEHKERERMTERMQKEEEWAGKKLIYLYSYTLFDCNE